MPRIRFRPSDREIRVPKGARLIDSIREAGLPIARACGDDLICAKCGVEILAGNVTRESPVEARVKARNRVDPVLRLACALRVHTDLEITAPYWGAVGPERALIIVDHGSRRPEAHAHLEDLAAQVRQRAPDVGVFVAHLELAEPDLASAVASAVDAGARSIAVHPLLLAPGRHLAHDLPDQVAAERARHPTVEITLTDALGSSPDLADLILRSAGGDP